MMIGGLQYDLHVGGQEVGQIRADLMHPPNEQAEVQSLVQVVVYSIAEGLLQSIYRVSSIS